MAKAQRRQISWKLSIPVSLFLSGCVVALWLMPSIPEPSPEAHPLIYFSMEAMRGLMPILRWLATVAVPFFIYVIISQSMTPFRQCQAILKDGTRCREDAWQFFPKYGYGQHSHIIEDSRMKKDGAWLCYFHHYFKQDVIGYVDDIQPDKKRKAKSSSFDSFDILTYAVMGIVFLMFAPILLIQLIAKYVSKIITLIKKARSK